MIRDFGGIDLSRLVFVNNMLELRQYLLRLETYLGQVVFQLNSTVVRFLRTLFPSTPLQNFLPELIQRINNRILFWHRDLTTRNGI